MKYTFFRSGKDRRPGLARDQDAVSEVIGTIIILAITVTMMSGVIVWVNGYVEPPDAAVNADIHGQLDLLDSDENGIYEGGSINMTHMGGNVILAKSVDIKIFVDNTLTSYELSGSEGPDLGVSWNIGEKWTKSLTGYSNVLASQDLSTQEVKVQIIDTKVSKIIEEILLQVGSKGGNVPKINMLWLEGAEGKRTTDFINDGKDRFTVKAIIYDQDGNLPKDGQKLATKVGYVTVDLKPLGLLGAQGGANAPLWDLDGDSVYESNGTHVIPLAYMAGGYQLNVTAKDFAGMSVTRSTNLTVTGVPLGILGTPKIVAWVSPNPVARYQGFTVHAAISDLDENVRNESVYVNFTDTTIGTGSVFQLTDPDGDGIWTMDFTLNPPISPGKYHVTVNVTDFDEQGASTNITFNVSMEFSPHIFGWGINPNPVVKGNQIRVWCYVNDIDGDLNKVDCDLSSVKGTWTNVTMNKVAGTNKYETSKLTVPANTAIGAYAVAIHASDPYLTDNIYTKLYVNGLYGPNITAVLVSPNPTELTPLEQTNKNKYTAYCFVEDGDDNLDVNKVYIQCGSLFGSGKMYMNATNVTGVFTWTGESPYFQTPGMLGTHTLQFWAFDLDTQVSFLEYDLNFIWDSTDSGEEVWNVNETANVGALPTYLKWVNGRQGYDIFNGTNLKANLDNPTRDFRQGVDWMWIRVASRDLSEVSVINKLIFTNVSSGEVYIYYPDTAIFPTIETRPSTLRAFTLYTAKGPYFEFQVRIDPTEFPLGRYLVNIMLQDSTPEQFGGPYKFIAVDTVNITDADWNMPFVPFMVTYRDANMTNETHSFTSFDIIYLRLAVKSTNLAADVWGDIEIGDFSGGLQMSAKPPSGSLLSTVSKGTFDYQGETNIPCYVFSIDLRYYNGDAWIPGNQGYTLNIKAFNDDNEPDSGVYKLSKNIKIDAPNKVKDLVVGTEGIMFGHKNFANIQYAFHFENNQFWTKTILEQEDSTPGGGGSTAIEHFETISFQDADSDGDLDVIAGTTGDGLPDRVLIYENRLIDAGQFEDQLVLASGYVANTIEPCDVDGDGDHDIVIGTDSGGYFYENTAGYTPHTFGSGVMKVIAVGNLYGNDSFMDVVVATGTAAVGYKATISALGAINLNSQGSIATGTVDDVAVADFNGDLLDDVVISGGTAASSVIVYYNLGGGVFGTGGSSAEYKAGGEDSPPAAGTIDSGTYLTTQTEDSSCEMLKEEQQYQAGGVTNDDPTAESSLGAAQIVSGSYSNVGAAAAGDEVMEEIWYGGNWQLLQNYTVGALTEGGVSWSLKIEAEITGPSSGTGGGAIDTFTVKWSWTGLGGWTAFSTAVSIDGTWLSGSLKSFDFPSGALDGKSQIFLQIEDSTKTDQGGINQGSEELTIYKCYVATTTNDTWFSYLEQEWSISVGAGYSLYTFDLRANQSDTNETEKYSFQYSVDNRVTFKDFTTPLVVFQNYLTDFENYAFQSGDSPSGVTVYIRAINDVKGTIHLDYLGVDFMQIKGVTAGGGTVVGDGFAVEVGDADGDGDPDVFTASDGQLYVHQNNGTTGASAWSELDDPDDSGISDDIDLLGNTEADLFRVADMNGDGFADMVVTADDGTSLGVIYVFYANGAGQWEPIEAVDVNAESYEGIGAKLDNDILGIDVGQSEGGPD